MALISSPSPSTTKYIIKFSGHRIHTVVTSRPAVVRSWIAYILHRHRYRLRKLVVGLDTEWCFHGHQPVAILQLCVGTKCLIFQIARANNVPNALVRFLANPCFKFVGKGVELDARKLEEGFRLRLRTIEDVGKALAEKSGVKAARGWGLNDLVKAFLGMGMEKDKEITMSRWDGEWLSSRQVEYACIDAFVSFMLGMEARRWPEEGMTANLLRFLLVGV